MKTFNRSYLDHLAEISARTLRLVGIRRLSGLHFGRGGYFLTALMVALAAQSCSANSANHTAGKNPIGDENSDGDPIRIQDLNKEADWLKFKAIWKNLDTISPTKQEGDFPTVYYYIYNEGGDPYRMADSINKLITGLEPKMYRLVEKSLIDSAEVRLLVTTAKARVDYIFTGYNSMITRMMPPPGQVRREGAIADLEMRIDSLLMLKAKGKVADDELDLALKNVYRELATYGYLEIVTKNERVGYSDELYFMTLTNKDTTDLVSLSIADFENQRAEFLKKYKPEKADESEKQLFEAYERTHKELTAFKAILPKYAELVRDLSFND
jgi:hypothetical protein